MKLQYIKLYNQYRSLKPFEQNFRKHKLLKGKIDPITLVGLNGSGKSNFLELIADIFYELEVYFLHKKKLYTKDSPKYFAYSNNKTKDFIYFEIRYKIKDKFDIKVIREEHKKSLDPQFFIKKKQDNSLFNEEVYEPLSTEEARNYLPNVVAYTSGLNDLLTLPFIELQDYYAQQVANEAKKTERSLEEITSPILSLLNYESNAAIVVANLLLAPKAKLQSFKEYLRINKLNSFRIIIRWDKLYSGRKLELTNELQTYIDNLKDCALLHENKIDKEGEVDIMDFIVNETTIKLFVSKFGTPKKLFDALTKLNLLNTLCIKKAYRNTFRNKREKGQLLKFPQIASLDKIFSIERIELILNSPNVRTEYEKISDGEHQFIHIIGGILLFDEESPERDTLYLLDEPDTHFNPLWRSTLFYELEKILINKNVEFFITTHSPFVLSDSHGYNVYKFNREGDNVTFKRSDKETYGSEFQNILDDIFNSELEKHIHFKHQKAKKSYLDIEKLDKEISEINSFEVWLSKSEEFQKRISLLGPSFDKTILVKTFVDKEQALRDSQISL